MGTFTVKTDCYTLTIGAGSAIEYAFAGETIAIRWPSFLMEAGGTCTPSCWEMESERDISKSVREYAFSGRLEGGLALRMELRIAAGSPFIRFRYILSADRPRRMTASDGRGISYMGYAADARAKRTEVRLSDYDAVIHGYCISEIDAFEAEDEIMGPILAEERENVSFLSAYEHGSMYPDKFIAFARDKGDILIRSVRGNYPNGQDVSLRPYETVWLQFGGVKGGLDDLACAYRTFQLKYASPNAESRKPYIFYNTWAFQERNRFWNGKTYLSDMNQARMEQEIDAAHRMGVDVFVIDTGWYEKTGDWEEDRSRFPLGIRHLADMLKDRGMKLGLWFNPTVAAKSSRILQGNRPFMAARGGNPVGPFPVWETEDSYQMCIVSDYWKVFADRLIELADRYGVRYFKWDAVDMYGCECPDHLHGGRDNAPEELRDVYAFEVGRYMSRIVDRVCAAHPDVIVDVDVTERNRYVGLGFLASGKFFTMNNGPYYSSYGIDVPEDVWSNIFVRPGPARTWIMRGNLSYDKWIPSVLMMAHYLPDDPASSQMLNLASLILGQNGIWGDLLKVSEEGKQLFSQVLGVYKRVRGAITEACPVVTGRPGLNVEVHEKLNENGEGAVVLFAAQPGEYKYRLHGKRAPRSTVFGNAVAEGERVVARFDEPGAVIVFFEQSPELL